MYAWLVGKLIRKGYADAVSGDMRVMLALASDDVELDFPGHNQFAGTMQGKPAVARWMDRFASLGPTFRIQDVIVSGPPWRMRVGVRFADSIGDDYANEGMEYLRIGWGKLRRIEVFLDTERISAWESRHPEMLAV